MSESEKINRRGFLSIATWSISGLISPMMGIPAIAFVLGPAFAKKKDPTWTRLGSINKLELGTPTLFKANLIREAGWLVEGGKIGGYRLTDNGRQEERR